MAHQDPSAALAQFAAALRFSDIPAPVLRRAEDLFLDWFASALAGKGARPVESITRFMRSQGPTDGPSQILIDRSSSHNRRLYGEISRLQTELGQTLLSRIIQGVRRLIARGRLR